MSDFWNAVKLSWKRWNAVENAKLDGPFSCNWSHLFVIFCSIYQSYFGASLSELQYLYASPFLFFSFELIYLSTYLPAIYLSICLHEVICLSFLKAVWSVETVPFIKTVYCEILIQKRLYMNFTGLCIYVLSSKIVELDSQTLLFVPMF